LQEIIRNRHMREAKINLRRLLRGRVDCDVSLSRFTSYRVGGPADLFIQPVDMDDLINLLGYLRQNAISRFIIGKGTNLLVHDRGYRGAVIFLGRTFRTVEVNKTIAVVQAGAQLGDFLATLAENGLGGLEKLAGIPGSVGGAVYMNAGAFGSEIFDALVTVTVMEDSGQIVELPKSAIDFSYRHGLTDDQGIILAAKFELTLAEPVLLRKTMSEIWARRKAKQPLSYHSAGSVFKRPAGGFAGVYIEQAGLKGCRVGGAVVSTKHANFILNKYHASAQNIFDLIQKVSDTVDKKFGVQLEKEIQLVGWNK